MNISETAVLTAFNTGGGSSSGGGINPSGTKQINENGVYNVAAYANVDVNVPQPEEPSGDITLTQNGVYDIAEYASATVGVVPTKDCSLTIVNNSNKYVSVARSLFRESGAQIVSEGVDANTMKTLPFYKQSYFSIFQLNGLTYTMSGAGEVAIDETGTFKKIVFETRDSDTATITLANA